MPNTSISENRRLTRITQHIVNTNNAEFVRKFESRRTVESNMCIQSDQWQINSALSEFEIEIEVKVFYSSVSR